MKKIIILLFPLYLLSASLNYSNQAENIEEIIQKSSINMDTNKFQEKVKKLEEKGRISEKNLDICIKRSKNDDEREKCFNSSDTSFFKNININMGGKENELMKMQKILKSKQY